MKLSVSANWKTNVAMSKQAVAKNSECIDKTPVVKDQGCCECCGIN